MSTQTVTCTCGQRITERVDFISPAYVVTFAKAETNAYVLDCPSCGKPIYPMFRNGELKRAA